MMIGVAAVGAVAGASVVAPIADTGQPEVAELAAAATEDPADPTRTEPTEPDGGVDEVEAVPATYALYLSRDPFEAVVEESDGAQETATGDGPQPPTSGSLTEDGEVVDSGPPTEPPDGDAGDGDGSTNDDEACQGGSDELVCDGRVISLEGVELRDDGPRAEFVVDTETYLVAEGGSFAIGFTLESLESDTALIVYEGEAYLLTAGATSK